MKRITTTIAVLSVLIACAHKKPAEEPENSDESPSESSKGEKSASEEMASTESVHESLMSSSTVNYAGSSTERAQKATIHDDTEKKILSCVGSKIPDLLAATSQAACELPDGALPSTQHASKDVVTVHLIAPSTIAPGSTAQINVVVSNTGKDKLPLDFTADPDPRFEFELYTKKGARVDRPAGREPPLPPSMETPPAHLARVVLNPNGTANMVLSWHAVKYKWADKEKAKGMLGGHGYPREPAGPLPTGKYVLRLVMPLANVDETGDHEVSQPRADIEIAGKPEVAPPPPPPAPAASAPPQNAAPAASAAPAGSSEAAVESKFLKAVGGAPPPAASASSSARPAQPHPKKH